MRTVIVYQRNKELESVLTNELLKKLVKDVLVRMKRGGAKMYYVGDVYYELCRLPYEKSVDISISVKDILLSGEAYMCEELGTLVVKLVKNTGIKVL